MAYVNVAEWKPDQVTEWLKGLDSTISQYLPLFSNIEISGQQLLNVRSEDLKNLGIKSLGHQEIILEAVEHLRNFHYELDRENLQLLALRLSCQAHSLHNELLRHTDSQPVSTQTLADVASVVRAVKPLVCWLDRSPFSGQVEYADRKTDLLKYSLEIATCAQRDRFAERPVEEIRCSCGKLAAIADGIIQDIADPLILQPASLDLATLRKRGGDDLGFFILPSFYGVHQIGEIKFGSPAHQCGKVEEGDEVVQVNYQTVVGWQRKKVMALFEESLTDVFLTLKKRPRHTKVYGQIYMKPYRLPSKKRAPAYTRWHDNLPSPRPELLPIPDFEIPVPRDEPKSPSSKHIILEPISNNITSTSSESDDVGSGGDEHSIDYELEGHASPTSMRLYLPKPRVPVQRRATITGASPTSHVPPVDLEKFWRELKLEKKWKFNGKTPESHNSNPECRVLRNKSPCEHNERPSTCLGFEKSSSKDYIKQIDYVVKADISPKGILTLTNNNNGLSEPKQESTGDVATTNPFLENEKVVLPPSAQRAEKRFITRLELIVDPNDSRIEFAEVSLGGVETKSSLSNEPQSVTFSSPCADDDTLKFSGKTRKISTESQVGELPAPRERGRLDKSFSTPAYDLSGLVGLEMKPGIKDEIENVDKDFSPKFYIPNEPISEQLKISSGDASSAEKEDITRKDIFKFPSVNMPLSNATTINPGIPQTELLLSNSCDVNSNPIMHGRIVETINRHLLDSCERDGDVTCDGLVNDSSANQSKQTMTHTFPGSPGLVLGVSTPRFRSGSEDDFNNGNHSYGDWYPCAVDNLDAALDCNLNSPSATLAHQKLLKPNESSCTDKDTSYSSIPSEISSPKLFSCDVKKTPPTPPTRHHVPSESTDQSLLSSQQPRVPIKICINPPEPPPRPNPPNRYPSNPLEQHKSLIRAKANSKPGTLKAAFGSPKVSRKKNPLLAKRRTVSVKELGTADNQGWLYRRLRIGDSGAQWIKGWFILKGTTFYGFKSREANKADCFISLPGFTTSPAEEVKSRKFAFKVYHTGTVFYFAAESEEELVAWMDCLSMATYALDVTTLKTSAAEGAVFSETEDEGDDDDEAEVADSCFPSPKMRKFTNFLSGHSNHPSSVSSTSGSPKAARSHQNLATSTDSKSSDIQKRFGSLKKLGYRSKYTSQLSTQSSSSATSLPGTEQSQDVPSAPHSLDRKVLRFLSSSKSQNVPVPTSQFKSYRRVIATEPCSTYSKHNEGAPSSRGEEALLDVAVGPQSGRSFNYPFGESDVRRNNRGFDSRGGDTAAFLTLEQFMLQRQEEERQQNQLLHPQQDRFRERDQEREPASTTHREASEAYTGYTEDPVLSRHKSLEKRRTPPPAPPTLSPSHQHSTLRPIPAARTILPMSGSVVARDAIPEPPAIVPRTSKPSSEALENRELSCSSKHSLESTSDVPRRAPLALKQLRLKNAAMYQPPPVPFSPLPNLGPTFEMHLDHRGTAGNSLEEVWEGVRSKGASSKIRQFLSPKRGHHPSTPGHLSSAYPQENSMSTPHRTILGSPRLHRALFRQNDECRPKLTPSDASNSSLYSPSSFGLSGPSATSSPSSSLDWSSDHAPPLSPKPTMGVAMLGKKPAPTVSSLISSLSSLSPPLSPPQTPLSAPPDYPGLEYPPVFEPGIYSLSDSSTFLSPSPSIHSPSSDNSSPHQLHQ